MVIIDEVSMVSNKMLLYIHQRLKEIFDTPDHVFFGGKCVVAVGDFFQLPPVNDLPVFASYRNELLNLCHPWSEFTMIELTEIMRQKEDKTFLELLNRIRIGQCYDEDVELLRSRIRTPTEPDYPETALHLWAENGPVDQHNEKMLAKIDKPEYILTATDKYPATVDQSHIKNILKASKSKTAGLPKELKLKKGARVMLTTNVDISDCLTDGQLGTIIGLKLSRNNKVEPIYIKFDDQQAGLNAKRQSADPLTYHYNAIPISQTSAQIKICHKKMLSPEIERTQFPLCVAWACTVHKVQGLTLSTLVVCFDLQNQKSFNYGQVYVALSRVTSIQGLYILGEFDKKHIKADRRVIAEYERLRQLSFNDNSLYPLPKPSTSNFVFTLLNVRSLKKHFQDFMEDPVATSCDIFFMTETQLHPSEPIETIQHGLQPFSLVSQPNIHKHCSLVAMFQPTVQLHSQSYITSVNGLLLLVRKRTTLLKVLLLYRSHQTDKQSFLINLRETIFLERPNVLLGDFNINYLDSQSSCPLTQMLETFNLYQIVAFPTFVSSRSLLDHVYIDISILPPSKVQTAIKSVYYSDHEAVKTCFQIIQ